MANLENFKPPTLNEVVDNGKKAADSFDSKPMGTAFAVTVFVLVGIIIYLGYQNNILQNKLNELGKIAFENALQNKMQEKVINVQADAISEVKSYLNDSIKAVDVQHFKGNIKTKQR